MWRTVILAGILTLVGVVAPSGTAAAAEPSAPPILIGLDADMSSGGARGGEAMRRGAVIAIQEVNAGGGVLGRPLKLVVRDHRGNPARGVDNMVAFAGMADIVAVIGGAHTPVAIHELKTIHDTKMVFVVAWAAGTRIVANGYRPNYVFRVSVRDEFAGGFLVRHARQEGLTRLGLLLERTAWGRSNEKAILDAAAELGVTSAGVEWFNWGTDDLTAEVNQLRAKGADALVLVSNPSEGAVAVEAVAAMPAGRRPPIISHWGITGSDFTALAPDAARIDLRVLQTFSFVDPPFPDRAAQVLAAYRRLFGRIEPAAVPAPVGTAHAYDVVRLLALAVRTAGTTDRPAVRDALEHLPPYQGLMKTYAPAFTPTRHDALSADDFRMARYNAAGHILPLPRKGATTGGRGVQ